MPLRPWAAIEREMNAQDLPLEQRQQTEADYKRLLREGLPKEDLPGTQELQHPSQVDIADVMGRLTGRTSPETGQPTAYDRPGWEDESFALKAARRAASRASTAAGVLSYPFEEVGAGAGDVASRIAQSAGVPKSVADPASRFFVQGPIESLPYLPLVEAMPWMRAGKVAADAGAPVAQTALQHAGTVLRGVLGRTARPAAAGAVIEPGLRTVGRFGAGQPTTAEDVTNEAAQGGVGFGVGHLVFGEAIPGALEALRGMRRGPSVAPLNESGAAEPGTGTGSTPPGPGGTELPSSEASDQARWVEGETEEGTGAGSTPPRPATAVSPASAGGPALDEAGVSSTFGMGLMTALQDELVEPDGTGRFTVTDAGLQLLEGRGTGGEQGSLEAQMAGAQRLPVPSPEENRLLPQFPVAQPAPAAGRRAPGLPIPTPEENAVANIGRRIPPGPPPPAGATPIPPGVPPQAGVPSLADLVRSYAQPGFPARAPLPPQLPAVVPGEDVRTSVEPAGIARPLPEEAIPAGVRPAGAPPPAPPGPQQAPLPARPEGIAGAPPSPELPSAAGAAGAAGAPSPDVMENLLAAAQKAAARARTPADKQFYQGQATALEQILRAMQQGEPPGKAVAVAGAAPGPPPSESPAARAPATVSPIRPTPEEPPEVARPPVQPVEEASTPPVRPAAPPRPVEPPPAPGRGAAPGEEVERPPTREEHIAELLDALKDAQREMVTEQNPRGQPLSGEEVESAHRFAAELEQRLRALGVEPPGMPVLAPETPLQPRAPEPAAAPPTPIPPEAPARPQAAAGPATEAQGVLGRSGPPPTPRAQPVSALKKVLVPPTPSEAEPGRTGTPEVGTARLREIAELEDQLDAGVNAQGKPHGLKTVNLLEAHINDLRQQEGLPPLPQKTVLMARARARNVTEARDVARHALGQPETDPRLEEARMDVAKALRAQKRTAFGSADWQRAENRVQNLQARYSRLAGEVAREQGEPAAPVLRGELGKPESVRAEIPVSSKPKGKGKGTTLASGLGGLGEFGTRAAGPDATLKDAGVEAMYKKPPAPTTADRVRSVARTARAAWDEWFSFLPELRSDPAYRAARRVQQGDFPEVQHGVERDMRDLNRGLDTSGERDMRTRLVTLEAMIERAKDGLPQPGGFGLERLQAAHDELEARATPAVRAAVERYRLQMTREAAEDIKRGVLGPGVLKRGMYFPYQVLDYADALADSRLFPAELRKPARPWARTAEGGTLAIDLDFDSVVPSHLMRVRMARKIDDFAYDWLGKRDILPKMGDAERKQFFGTTAGPKREGQLIEKNGQRYIAYRYQQGGEGTYVPSTGLEQVAVNVMAPGGKLYVIPEAMAKDLTRFRQRPELTLVEQAFRRYWGWWKGMVIGTLGIPFHVRNFLGDLADFYREENAFGFATALRVPTVMRGALGISKPEYANFQKLIDQQRVTQSTLLSLEHLRDLHGLSPMEKLEQVLRHPLKTAGAVAGLREAHLRVAKALADYERIQKGGQVRTRGIDIRGLEDDTHATLGKVAREAIVDYENVSEKFRGGGVRGGLLPFATWYQQEIPNWARATGAPEFVQGDVKAGAAKAAEFGLKFGLPFFGLWYWNNHQQKDVERRLPLYLQHMPLHLNTGWQTPEGKDLVYGFNFGGDVTPRLIGIDRLPHLLGQYQRGEITGKQFTNRALTDAAKGPFKFVGDLSPLYGIVSGLLTGRDNFSGRAIVDPHAVGTKYETQQQADWLARQLVPLYGQARLAMERAERKPGTATTPAGRFVEGLLEGQLSVKAGVEHEVDPFLGKMSAAREAGEEAKQTRATGLYDLEQGVIDSQTGRGTDRLRQALMDMARSGQGLSTQEVNKRLASPNFLRDLLEQKLRRAPTAAERERARQLLEGLRKQQAMQGIRQLPKSTRGAALGALR